MSRPRKFVIVYTNGVEHITLAATETKEDLLNKARQLGKTHGWGEITWIKFNDWGDDQPIWNGQREERTGDGWLYDWPALSLGLVFSEEPK